MQLVAFPARLQSLFQADAQGLVHGVDQVAARCMVIGMIAVPVLAKFVQVEVVALHRLLAALNGFDRALVERHRGQPRQRAQAFLAAGIARINLHGIDVHWHAAQPADGIDHEERAVRVRHALKFLERLAESGGGFGDGGGEDFRPWMLLKCPFERFSRERLAQFGLQINHLCTRSFRDLHDHAAEEAQAARDERIAFFKQVGEYGLRAGEAGAGDAQCHLVLRLKDLAQQAGRIFQNGEKFRVDVAQLRRCGHA